MSERRAISSAMKLASLFLRQQIICVECKQPIADPANCQWDHRHAMVHGGGHTAENIGPVHYDPCHKRKTARDVRDNAHVKRLRGERKPRVKKQIARPANFQWPKTKIQSRNTLRREEVRS